MDGGYGLFFYCDGAGEGAEAESSCCGGERWHGEKILL